MSKRIRSYSAVNFASESMDETMCIRRHSEPIASPSAVLEPLAVHYHRSNDHPYHVLVGSTNVAGVDHQAHQGRVIHRREYTNDHFVVVRYCILEHHVRSHVPMCRLVRRRRENIQILRCCSRERIDCVDLSPTR